MPHAKRSEDLALGKFGKGPAADILKRNLGDYIPSTGIAPFCAWRQDGADSFSVGGRLAVQDLNGAGGGGTNLIAGEPVDVEAGRVAEQMA